MYRLVFQLERLLLNRIYTHARTSPTYNAPVQYIDIYKHIYISFLSHNG